MSNLITIAEEAEVIDDVPAVIDKGPVHSATSLSSYVKDNRVESSPVRVEPQHRAEKRSEPEPEEDPRQKQERARVDSGKRTRQELEREQNQQHEREQKRERERTVERERKRERELESERKQERGPERKQERVQRKRDPEPEASPGREAVRRDNPSKRKPTTSDDFSEQLAAERAAKEALMQEAAEAKAAAAAAKAEAKAAQKEAAAAKQAALDAANAAKAAAASSPMQSERPQMFAAAPPSPAPSASSPRRGVGLTQPRAESATFPQVDGMPATPDGGAENIASLTRRAEEAERIAAEAQRSALEANAMLFGGMNAFRAEMRSWVDEQLNVSPHRPVGSSAAGERDNTPSFPVQDAYGRRVQQLEQKLLHGEMLTYEEQMTLMTAARQVALPSPMQHFPRPDGVVGGVSRASSAVGSQRPRLPARAVSGEQMSGQTLTLMDDLDAFSRVPYTARPASRGRLPGIGSVEGVSSRPGTSSTYGQAGRPSSQRVRSFSARRSGSPPRQPRSPPRRGNPTARMVRDWDLKARVYDPYFGGATPPWMKQ